MQNNITKPFWTSKELWLVAIGVLNFAFDKIGWPSIEPTPELYASLLVLIGVVRAWFTNAGVRWSA